MLQEHVEPDDLVEHTQDMTITDEEWHGMHDSLKGLLDALYETGDIDKVEDNLEEICSFFGYKIPATSPIVSSIKNQTKKDNTMTTQIAVRDSSEQMLEDIQNTQKMCKALIETPHYRKMGAEGIYAIVEKSRSIGVNPMDSLNGGMYFVQGKVEMSAFMMNGLIRGGKHKHSISKSNKSDETICILHGKRADNGDTWVESFSIEDAKKAGIYRNQWIKYPKDMLFARALSRLARQLFPDVIKGCYVQGEIEESPLQQHLPVIEMKESLPEIISEDEAEHLYDMIGTDDKYRACVLNFLQSAYKTKDLKKMPRILYEKIIPVATRKYEERKEIVDVEATA
ncbi:MAG: hypothetical protein K1000chlam2_00045 [Chlamydiae bacterium]|nr:hypothetical protein [Chlamydiota bacterium]